MISLTQSVDLPLFSWLLDKFAVSQGKQEAAVFDLLPELRYPAYRQLIPGIRIAVMCRNPQRRSPRGCSGAPTPIRQPTGTDVLKACCFRVVSFRGGHPVAVELFGEDVKSFSFNRLLAADVSEQQRLAETFDLDSAAVNKAFDFEPQFAYQPDRGLQGAG